jgi:acetyl esterase/lipase
MLRVRWIVGLTALLVGFAAVAIVQLRGARHVDGPAPELHRPGAVAADPKDAGGLSLAAARKDFKTQIGFAQPDRRPAPMPPPAIFTKISYPSPVGPLPAYLTPDPKDQAKHPAIVWITGGDTNSIGDVWTPAPRDNEQTASAFRKAGIVMMFPSLRGGNDNPGKEEGFYGEVDDVVAAGDFLARQPYVDPARIYLGGHSTGGTLVLLTAETTTRFRAVFAYGPAAQGSTHSTFFKDFDFSKYDPREVSLRAPALWLGSIHSPVFVIEGESSPSNIGPLHYMQEHTSNPSISFLPVAGASHFSVLAPGNELIAGAILKDTGPTPQIALTRFDFIGAVAGLH